MNADHLHACTPARRAKPLAVQVKNWRKYLISKGRLPARHFHLHGAYRAGNNPNDFRDLAYLHGCTPLKGGGTTRAGGPSQPGSGAAEASS